MICTYLAERLSIICYFPFFLIALMISNYLIAWYVDWVLPSTNSGAPIGEHDLNIGEIKQWKNGDGMVGGGAIY